MAKLNWEKENKARKRIKLISVGKKPDTENTRD